MRYNYAVSGSQVMDLTVGKTVNVAGSIDLCISDPSFSFSVSIVSNNILQFKYDSSAAFNF